MRGKVLNLVPKLEERKRLGEELKCLLLPLKEGLNQFVAPKFAWYFPEKDSIFATVDDRQLKDCVLEPSFHVGGGGVFVIKSPERSIIGFQIYRVSCYFPDGIQKHAKPRMLLAKIALATRGFEKIFGKDSEDIKKIIKETDSLPLKLP